MKTYTIKQLEWVDVPDSTIHANMTAKTGEGDIYCLFQRNEGDVIDIRMMGAWSKKLKIADVDLAKSACQQHYESRMLQGLVEDDRLERVREFCERVKEPKSSSDREQYCLEQGEHDFAQEVLSILNEEKEHD